MEILLCIEVNIDTGVGYAFGLESNQYRAYWVQFCSDNVFYVNYEAKKLSLGKIAFSTDK